MVDGPLIDHQCSAKSIAVASSSTLRVLHESLVNRLQRIREALASHLQDFRKSFAILLQTAHDTHRTRPKSDQNRSQIVLKLSRFGSWTTNSGQARANVSGSNSRRRPRAPKSAQERPKSAPRAPKSIPRVSLGAPKSAQVGPAKPPKVPWRSPGNILHRFFNCARKR